MQTSKKFTLSILLIVGMLVLSLTGLSAKSVLEELNSAKKAKKSVFLVVTQTGTNATQAINIANQANKLVKESIVVTLDRSDPANSAVVSEMKLATIPVPMIMVVGVTGQIAGGVPAEGATAEMLVKMVPSPKKAEALGYINNKKPVFIVGYKKSFTDKIKVLENCQSAVITLKNEAKIVEVDLDDASETAFLTQVGIDIKSKTTQIAVFNNMGKNVGNFSGPTEPAKLVTAVKTEPKGCCPPGSGKTCVKK